MKKIHLAAGRRYKQASALVRLILVIGVVSLILTAGFISINPAEKIAQANNTKRNDDVIKIINALHEYAAENKGAYPQGIPEPGSSALSISTRGADICSALVPKYLNSLPTDPKSVNGGLNINCTGEYDTGYAVELGFIDKKLIISAPKTELPLMTQISVTR